VWEKWCAVEAATGDVRGAMGETGQALTCNGTAWSNAIQDLAPWRLRRTEMRRRRDALHMEVVMLREGGRTQLASAQHALFGLASARPRPGSFKFTPLLSDLTYGRLIGR
jgi:hypothetical protein